MGLLKLKKVLICDKIADICVQVLSQGGVEVTYKPGLSKADLLNIIPEYNGLVVRSATKVTDEVIKAAVNLEIIGRAGTGTDNIDIPTASERGIVVMNTPGGNTASAAEHTCALILAMCRNLPNRHTELMKGAWNRINGIELSGKTLGIIGLGRIGLIVANRMQAFGMNTIGYDPFVTADTARQHNVEFQELEDMWAMCDFITVHVPLIPSTKHLINSAVFAKCKKGVRIVNCARGGIIDEEALLNNLISGQVACAALDVFEEEPPAKDSPLLQHPNLIASPHLGASTLEAQTRVAKEIAEQFIALRDGQSTFGCLNAPLLRSALKEPTKCKLAQYLGMVLYTLVPGADMILVECNADSKQFVPQAVVAGYLTAQGVPGSNLISVEKVAAEKELSYKYTDTTGDMTVSVEDIMNIRISGKCEGDLCFITKINTSNTLIPLTGALKVIRRDVESKLDVLNTIQEQISTVYFAGGFVFVAQTDMELSQDTNTLVFN